MKISGLTLIFLVVLVVDITFAKTRHTRRKLKKEETQPRDELDLIAEDEAKVTENEIKEVVKETPVKAPVDPCGKLHCGAGKECVINDKNEGECQCIKSCSSEVDDRRKVCTNHNQTFDSDCHVYRLRCLCTEGSDLCEDRKYEHHHVNYYGVCRDIPQCSEDEMKDFPRRMREWLFNVMQDLARRAELDEEFIRLEKEAEKMDKKWINAVIWKFCDLDTHPHDRSVSRHELFPIRAPLLAMEHCIAPFLDGCDANDDHVISLVEWGKCLGLEENEIDDKCMKYRGSFKTRA